MKPAALVVAAATAFSTFAAPAFAAEGKRTWVAPRTDLSAPAPAADPVEDTIIESGAGRIYRSARQNAAVPNLWDVGDGLKVTIQVSDFYLPSPEAEQDLAALLGSFPHGAEIQRLTAFVMPIEELIETCGGDALACYTPDNNTMYISGDGSIEGEAPNEYVIAHEYGHHLANSSKNPPFDGGGGAIVPGPKNWATYANVCIGAETGYYSLDDPASDEVYYRFPGEVFAETFAQKSFPGIVPWHFDTREPGAGDFAAIDQDLRSPWTAPVTTQINKRFKKKGGSVYSKVIDTPLDGDVAVALHGPKKANFDLQLYNEDATRYYDKDGGKGSEEAVAGTVCGERKTRITVTRKKKSGKFTLDIVRP
jgi:hypothetical protein